MLEAVIGDEMSMFVVGFVNYKTSVYMETQFKIYRDFAGEEFQIVIVENSRNMEEYDRILQLAKKSAIPIDILSGDTAPRYSSDAHGCALQQLYNHTLIKYPKATYLLTQDPDFFWVQPHFLTFLKEKLQTCVVVGAPYPEDGPTWSNFVGPHDFPVAFGAAHQIDALYRIKADFRWAQGPPAKDVGWQIRERLKDEKYYAFVQEKFEISNSHSFSTDPTQSKKWMSQPRKYLFGNTILAYHLFFGSFEMSISRGMKLAKSGKICKREKINQTMPSAQWQEGRIKLCEFFWKEINDAAK